MLLHDTMPAELKVIHKARFVFQKKDHVRDEVLHIRLKERPHAAQRAVGNNQRIDRPRRQLTLELCGLAQEVVSSPC